MFRVKKTWRHHVPSQKHGDTMFRVTKHDAALGLRSRNGGLPLVPQRSENFGAHDTDLPAILGCFRSERI